MKSKKHIESFKLEFVKCYGNGQHSGHRVMKDGMVEWDDVAGYICMKHRLENGIEKASNVRRWNEIRGGAYED